MKNDFRCLIAILCLGLNYQTVFAKDLSNIITSLYGGDGVQLVEATSGFSHAPHFQDEALQRLSKLTRAISDTQIPYPNANGGINFDYDPVLDEFIESQDTHSLLFTDLAKTLGKGRFSGGITYSNISYDQIDGQSLDSLTLALDHEDVGDPGFDLCIGGQPPPQCYLFERDLVLLDLDIELDSEVLFLFGAFGLTNNIDIEIILPIIKNRLSIRSNARVHEHDSSQFFAGTLHEFDEDGINSDDAHAHAKENKIGFGDLQLQGKWNFYSDPDFDLATMVEFLIPTGDEDNYMGSDTLSITPKLILSTNSGIAGIPINAHLNIGYEFSTGDGHNEFLYAAALEYSHEFNKSVLTTAFEVLGDHVMETRTGFGDDQVDAAIGAKWSFLENQSIFFNYRFPLNDDGLRASNIFSVGYAGTF